MLLSNPPVEPDVTIHRMTRYEEATHWRRSDLLFVRPQIHTVVFGVKAAGHLCWSVSSTLSRGLISELTIEAYLPSNMELLGFALTERCQMISYSVRLSKMQLPSFVKPLV